MPVDERERDPAGETVDPDVDIDDCARFARRMMEQSDPRRIQELVAGFDEGAMERA